ncbi:MAG: hypothetical protein IPG79_07655 [Saprospiraceae bacterium]|nr:hypothetical protein [Saprospiraceae bacterium]
MVQDLKSIIAKTLVVFLLMCSFQTAFAQAPQKMSYQAVIRNSSNTLVINQQVGIRVSILKGSSTGTEVYREIFNPNPATNSNGLVSLEIGAGIPLSGTFAGIDWANGPYFIKRKQTLQGVQIILLREPVN